MKLLVAVVTLFSVWVQFHIMIIKGMCNQPKTMEPIEISETTVGIMDIFPATAGQFTYAVVCDTNSTYGYNSYFRLNYTSKGVELILDRPLDFDGPEGIRPNVNNFLVANIHWLCPSETSPSCYTQKLYVESRQEYLPEFNLDPIVFNISENVPVGTTIGTLRGRVIDWDYEDLDKNYTYWAVRRRGFPLDGYKTFRVILHTGDIKVRVSPDYEKNTYFLIFVKAWHDYPYNDASVTVRINVKNLNEYPTRFLCNDTDATSTCYYWVHLTPKDELGKPVKLHDGPIKAIDPDGGLLRYTIAGAHGLVDNKERVFRINRDTGELIYNERPSECGLVLNVRIRAEVYTNVPPDWIGEHAEAEVFADCTHIEKSVSRSNGLLRLSRYVLLSECLLIIVLKDWNFGAQ